MITDVNQLVIKLTDLLCYDLACIKVTWPTSVIVHVSYLVSINTGVYKDIGKFVSLKRKYTHTHKRTQVFYQRHGYNDLQLWKNRSTNISTLRSRVILALTSLFKLRDKWRLRFSLIFVHRAVNLRKNHLFYASFEVH